MRLGSLKHRLKEFVFNIESPRARSALDLLLEARASRMIPLMDYRRAHDQILPRLGRELSTILGFSTEFESELYVRRFESDFAKLCNRRYGVGTHSGTAALQLSLAALGIGEGDEVITVPNTYIATALAISNTGAKPVFVDVDDKTFNMDPDLIEAAITDRTRAIIPVHLYGQVANMRPITALAAAYRLTVIEDACQAFGAELDGKKAGSHGHIGCFSFSSSKNLGGLGNGGMVVSDDHSVIERLRTLRDPASNKLGLRRSCRTPCYLDAIQVAFLRAKLPFADTWTTQRRAHASQYRRALATMDVRLPVEARDSRHSYYRFAIRTRQRKPLQQWLHSRGVRTGTAYSPCLHLSHTYSDLGYTRGAFPRTEAGERETLLLPISSFMSSDEQEQVTTSIEMFFRQRARTSS